MIETTVLTLTDFCVLFAISRGRDRVFCRHVFDGRRSEGLSRLATLALAPLACRVGPLPGLGLVDFGARRSLDSVSCYQ